MKNSDNFWHQFKITTFVVATSAAVLVLWLCLNFAVDVYKEKIIYNWCNLQENTIDVIIDDISNFTGEGFHDNVSNYLNKRNKFTDTSYYIFYADQKVVFEKNNIITKNYKGKTIRETYGTYSYQGGYHLYEVLEKMEANQSGSDYFVKVHSIGNESVSWKVFSRGEINYIIGIVTPQNYILSQYGYDNFKNQAYTFGGICTFILMLLCFILVFAVNKSRNNMIEATKNDTLKSMKINELMDKVEDFDVRFQNLSTRDLLTGIYNRKFFDALMAKMESKIFLPLSVALMDINGLKLINNAFGYKKGDEIICKIAEICTEFCEEDDVLARYGNDEFVILMINTDFNYANEKVKKIQERIKSFYVETMPVTISYGIETKSTEDDDIYNTILLAQKNLGIDKLNATDSASSGTVSILKNILQQKTSETEEHCERLKLLASKLGYAYGLGNKKIEELGLLAYLHDVGKIAVADEILNKSDKLTDDEMEIMKTHPERGYSIAMVSPDLKVIAKHILQHHERYDGTGYPYGLKGEEITLEARIISIVDAFDAMVSKRVYHESRDIKFARDEIISNSGTQFDPVLAKLFIEIIDKEGNKILE